MIRSEREAITSFTLLPTEAAMYSILTSPTFSMELSRASKTDVVDTTSSSEKKLVQSSGRSILVTFSI